MTESLVRDATFYASRLLELHLVSDPAERRSAWRQSMAELARAASEDGPGPLEGLRPEALRSGVRAALQGGLVDDLGWLAPAAAGTALYELAAALPLGPEQRELGRRVLARLLAADATTFVLIARSMARSGARGLASPGMRARVALVTELPLVLGVADAPLALALASRRELARQWIAEPSTGSLSSRRLAARLIERAAREAARRASYGDEHSLRVFKGDAVAAAWQRLLGDRESLVWRHVAVARGLLAPWVPELDGAIEAALSPSLSPTEWRRAAASLAAKAAVAPDAALGVARRVLSQGLLGRDPGVGSAFVWGLPRAAEAEGKAAELLFDLVMDHAGPEIGEAVVDLRTEFGESPFVVRCAARARESLSRRSLGGGDDGADAIARNVARDLAGAGRGEKSLWDQITGALQVFAISGSKEAHARAREILVSAKGSLDALTAIAPEDDGVTGREGSMARYTVLSALRDLDMSLLERDVLGHLVMLAGTGEARTGAEATDPLRDKLADWILVREGMPLVAQEDGTATIEHATVSLRRLRALLHLVDSDMGDEDEDAPRAARLRKRAFAIARVLVERFERDAPSPVRRTIIAALARALDALVRVGTCDVVDALLVVARHVADPERLGTLAEASMNPDLVHVLDRYARFAASINAAPRDALASYDEMTQDIDLDASGRTEALRCVLLRLGHALSALSSVGSLRELASEGSTEPEAVGELEGALAALAQLTMGARGRLDPDRVSGMHAVTHRPLAAAITRVLEGIDPALREPVVASALDNLLACIPKAIAHLVAATVWRVADLPVDGSRSPLTERAYRTSPPSRDVLPAWLPAGRTIGGFYVLRPLSAGAVGSVFVATRAEDRADPNAEKLALKVPEYSASAARQLSEAEFLKMFRDEAGALIGLPQHPNLARFVTFDAGSKPKPILVMELVEGVTLERLLAARSLDATRALRVLDDVLGALEAMHTAGVGHLDLKPSNVVMRRGEQAVLVDFGLAGRHIRPGCATGPYGAPEVWGAVESEEEPSPAKADVYAFACVAFETLLGRALFDAGSEMALISMHVAHDGHPAALRALSGRPAMAGLVEFLASALRCEPKKRLTASALRRDLSRLAPSFAGFPWPLDA